MGVQKLDVFALKRYAFTLSKTNNYFTLTTVLFSILIVFASIVMNYQTITHLWLPRDQLPIIISQSITYPDALTSTLICYKDKNANATTPKARIISQSLKNLSFPLMNEDMVRKVRPDAAEKLGNHFACFDIGGFNFTKENIQFYIEVQSTNASLFIESTTTESIISKANSTFIPHYQGQSRLVRIVHSVDSDSLRLNSPPIIRNTILTDDNTSYAFRSGHIFPWRSKNAKFMITLFMPLDIIDNSFANFSVISLKISRFDIGYIIGAVLSWISIFTMACAVIIGPIIEKKMSLSMAESLFEIQPHNRKPNVFKFIIAQLKRGYFLKEDHYVNLCERLQKIKDVGFMMKTLYNLKRVCIPTQEKDQILACDENFDKDAEDQIHLYANNDKKEEERLQFMQEDIKQENQSVTLRQSLLRFFDAGSDLVSFEYSRDGHGSKISVCLTLLFLIGFIAFLLIFNVIQYSTTVTITDVLDDYAYTTSRNEIIFGANQESGISVSLLNGNFEFLENVSLSNDPSCLTNLTSQQKALIFSSYEYFYCINQPITLVGSLSPNQTISLYIDNYNFQFSQLGIFHFSSPSTSPYYKPIQNYNVITAPSPGQIVYYQAQIRITQIITPNGNQSSFAQITPKTQVPNTLTGLIGLNISIRRAKTVVEETESSLFDIVQNVWGLAIVCFTVILFKFTKYINLHQKQVNMSPERAKFRENLCIFLARLDGLASGRHRRELVRARYYIKEPLYEYF